MTARILVTTLLPDLDAFYGDLRHRFDPSTHRGLGCHVTLLHLPTEPEHFPERLSGMAGTLRQFRHLTLAFNSVAQLPGTVYLAPDECGALRNLAQLIHLHMVGTPRESAFTPHVSVARYLAPDRQPLVLRDVQHRLEVVGPITTAALSVDVLRREQEEWRHVETIPLV